MTFMGPCAPDGKEKVYGSIPQRGSGVVFTFRGDHFPVCPGIRARHRVLALARAWKSTLSFLVMLAPVVVALDLGRRLSPRESQVSM